MKRRIVILIFIAALLFAGFSIPADGFADNVHPITLTITVDPDPELEREGYVPDMLFTISNESETDYTLSNAKLSGGYDGVERELDEIITVLAGGKREFDLYDVPVAADQLDVPVTYTLTWDENEVMADPETGEIVVITHSRKTTATITIEKFVVPELTVTASVKDDLVRQDETFTVEYRIVNETKFDMTGLRLYDPEQSIQPIALPADDLTAGETMTVSVEYTMGVTDMRFCPKIEYVSRRRNVTTIANKTVEVGSVTVDLVISSQAFPATADGTEFVITVKNNGNRTVTGIRLYDEINTPIGDPFDLPPLQTNTVRYTIKPGVSADVIRTVRFHAIGSDALKKTVRANDAESYRLLPYVEQESVRLELRVEPQKPYRDENGKLCVAFQFRISYRGDVRLRDAVLTETTLFHDVVSYSELIHGDTYYTQAYQIDGVESLSFRVDAKDPAGKTHSSQTVTVDMAPLREQVDRRNDPVYVVTTNPYMQDLDLRYREILKIFTVIALCIAAVCAIVCIILYAIERKIRQKLPGEFEEDMEKALRATKRRMDDPLFTDAPTEQFGYRAPIKLKKYGELTEEEVKARREQYANGFAEDLKRTGSRPSERLLAPNTSVRRDGEGTRVMPTVNPAHAPEGTRITPTVRPGAAASAAAASARGAVKAADETAAFGRPAAESSAARRMPESAAAKPAGRTETFRKPREASAADETAAFGRPAVKSHAARYMPEPAAAKYAEDTGAFRKVDAPVTVRPAVADPASNHTEDRSGIRRTVIPRAKEETPTTREPHEPNVGRAYPTRPVGTTALRSSAGLETAAAGLLLHRAASFDTPAQTAAPKTESVSSEPRQPESEAKPLSDESKDPASIERSEEIEAKTDVNAENTAIAEGSESNEMPADSADHTEESSEETGPVYEQQHPETNLTERAEKERPSEPHSVSKDAESVVSVEETQEPALLTEHDALPPEETTIETSETTPSADAVSKDESEPLQEAGSETPPSINADANTQTDAPIEIAVGPNDAEEPEQKPSASARISQDEKPIFFPIPLFLQRGLKKDVPPDPAPVGSEQTEAENEAEKNASPAKEDVPTQQDPDPSAADDAQEAEQPTEEPAEEAQPAEASDDSSSFEAQEAEQQPEESADEAQTAEEAQHEREQDDSSFSEAQEAEQPTEEPVEEAHDPCEPFIPIPEPTSASEKIQGQPCGPRRIALHPDPERKPVSLLTVRRMNR